VNSGLNVTRNRFDAIEETAILIDQPDEKTIDPDTPILGAADRPETTGFNSFGDVSGWCVQSYTGAPQTKAQYNDWGLYTPSQVEAKIEGDVSVEPIVGKSLTFQSAIVFLTDKNTGSAITVADNAEVRIASLSKTAVFDPQSKTWIFDDLPGQQLLTVRATADGYNDGTGAIDSNQPLDTVDIELAPGGGGSCGKDGKLAYAGVFLIIWLAGRQHKTSA
jgi:hypothetical protein